MNELFSMLKRSPQLRRSLLRRTLSRCAFGLTAALLWDRFVNKNGRTALFEYAFLFVGAVLAAMAWFSWLRLNRDRPVRPAAVRPRRRGGALADDLDEEPADGGTEDPRERLLCSVAADLLAAALFLLPALLVSLLGAGR